MRRGRAGGARMGGPAPAPSNQHHTPPRPSRRAGPQRRSYGRRGWRQGMSTIPATPTAGKCPAGPGPRPTGAVGGQRDQERTDLRERQHDRPPPAWPPSGDRRTRNVRRRPPQAPASAGHSVLQRTRASPQPHGFPQLREAPTGRPDRPSLAGGIAVLEKPRLGEIAAIGPVRTTVHVACPCTSAQLICTTTSQARASSIGDEKSQSHAFGQ